MLYSEYLNNRRGRIITAVHEFQHCVGTALQRDMEVWHEGAASGTVFDEVV